MQTAEQHGESPDEAEVDDNRRLTHGAFATSSKPTPAEPTPAEPTAAGGTGHLSMGVDDDDQHAEHPTGRRRYRLWRLQRG